MNKIARIHMVMEIDLNLPATAWHTTLEINVYIYEFGYAKIIIISYSSKDFAVGSKNYRVWQEPFPWHLQFFRRHLQPIFLLHGGVWLWYLVILQVDVVQGIGEGI